MNHNFLQNVARKQSKRQKGARKGTKRTKTIIKSTKTIFSMYWLFLDIWSTQAISIPGTCVKGYNLTLSVPLYCFLSLFLCPMYGGPGNTHVECLEQLVTNQQLIKKFLYTSHVVKQRSLGRICQITDTVCTEANQQWASFVSKIKLV